MSVPMSNLSSALAAPGGAVALIGGVGDLIDTTDGAVALQGRDVLWLVTAGAMDVFAVDAVRGGRWQFLGRLEAGAMTTGAVRGAGHTLVGRPLEGCELRRVLFADIARAQRAEWFASRPYGDLAPQEYAFCHGVELGLQALRPPATGTPPDEFMALVPDRQVGLSPGQWGRSSRGLVWIEVLSGKVRRGTDDDESENSDARFALDEGDWVSCEEAAVVTVRTTADLIVEGVLAHYLREHQASFLRSLDRRIQQINRRNGQRLLDRWRTGESVREEADLILRAVMVSSDIPGSEQDWDTGDDDAAIAAAHAVARAVGVPIADPVTAGAADARLSPVERISLASRFRTRVIKLEGEWWREDAGPLYAHLRTDAADGRRPVALLWRRGGYHVVDAAGGRRQKVTEAVAACIEPEAVVFYRPLPDRPVGALRLVAFGLRGSGADLRKLVLAGVGTLVVGLAVPVITGKVLGSYVPDAERGLIFQTCIALIVAAVGAAALMLLRGITILRIEGRFDANAQTAVWDRLLRLPTTFFANRSTGELAGAALGITAIRAELSGVLSIAVQSGLVALANMVLLFYYSVPLALTAVGFVVAAVAAFLALGLRQHRWQRDLVALTNKLNDRAFQTLRGLPKLRVAGAEPFGYAHWARDFARGRALQRRIGRTQNLLSVLNVGFASGSTLVLFVLFAGPARSSLPVGDFITVIVSVGVLLNAAIQATGAIVESSAAVPLYEQLKPVLRTMPEIPPVAAQPGELSGEIEVSHVSYRYEDNAPLAVDDVSFRVARGEFVAVVGESGCGKSTLLRLLIGFDDPTSGAVLYDGQRLSGLDRAAVRRQCGVVLQNAQPLNGTVLDCISGPERHTLDEVWAAAEAAGLAADIEKMAMGMHTVITDGGSTLSGGQRQRLMIAQALVRKPRILFFDEATSALDNEVQRIVTESTRKLRATRVVIAHRLSTIMDADRVIVMAAGRVVQQGPPAELLADTTGAFHRLVHRQTRHGER